MAAAYDTLESGSTELRHFQMVAKASGSPIVAGTVNWSLKALTGTNAGKWWRTSDGTWQVAEVLNAMTYQSADGNWTIDPTHSGTSPFTDAVEFIEYAQESTALHVPTARKFTAHHTPYADPQMRVDAGYLTGTSQTPGADLGVLEPDTNNKALALQNAVAALPHAILTDTTAGDFNTPNSAGAYIKASGSAADPLANAVPGSYTQGQAGYYLGRLAGANVITINPVGTTGNITLVRGRDYKQADGLALSLVNQAGTWPDLTSAQSITLYAKNCQSGYVTFSVTGTAPVPTPIPNQSVRFDVPKAATAAAPATTNQNQYAYEVVAVLADGDTVTLQMGALNLLPNASS